MSQRRTGAWEAASTARSCVLCSARAQAALAAPCLRPLPPTTVRAAQPSLRPATTKGERALTPTCQHPLPLRPAGSGAQVAPSVRPLDECPKARNTRFHHQRCVPLQIKNVLASFDVSESSRERSSSCPCGEGTSAGITHPTPARVAGMTPPPRTEAHHGPCRRGACAQPQGQLGHGAHAQLSRGKSSRGAEACAEFSRRGLSWAREGKLFTHPPLASNAVESYEEQK